MSSYEHHSPRADDRGSGRGRSQRHALAGREDAEEAWWASSDSSNPRPSGSRPQHQLLTRREREVSRGRSHPSLKSSASGRRSVSPEPREAWTTPTPEKRRGARSKAQARQHFGARDIESWGEPLDSRRKDREPDEGRGDSGAQRSLREGRDAEPEPREEHHARHRSRSRDWMPEGDRDGRSVDRSPQEEHHARRSLDRRRIRARSASTSSFIGSVSSSTSDSEDSRGTRHAGRRSRGQGERAPLGGGS